MAKLIEYDVSDVPESGGGGEQAPVGTYDAKIAHCVHRDQKKDGTPVDDLEVAFQIINEEESYSWVFTYIGLDEPSAWKMREFTDALGLKAKGKLDPDKMIGKAVRLKVNAGSYDGEYRAKAGRIMSSNGDGPAAEAPDDDAAPDADPNAFVPTREADSDAGSYDDWSDDDIKGEFEDRELSVSGRKTQKAMIAALRADDEEASGDADTVGDHDASATEDSGYPDGYEPQRETEEDSYDDWSDDDIEGEFTDRGLELPGGRGNARTKQLKALREDDENPKGGAAGGTDEYDSWSLEQLVTEAKDRNLTVPRGKKSEDDIIAILRADDGTDPF